jgi:streptogramin lyase
MELASGKTEMWKPYENLKGPHSVYGIYADPANNLWFLDFGGENIGRVDAKTGAVELHQTPTLRSRPRRGRFDDQGRLWFSMFNQDGVGVYDTKTGRFSEWQVPSRDFSPYDVVLDKNGYLWIGGMNADRIMRMNIQDSTFTEYPLPHSTNVRRVFVDNRTTPPTFWVGNNHGAAVIKMETLE